VLFIENLEIIKVLTYILKMNHYLVQACLEVASCERVDTEALPSLFIIQANTSTIESQEIILEIKKNPKLTNIPILLVGQLTESNQDELLSRYADDFLHWPSTPYQISVRIQNILKSKINENEMEQIADVRMQELLEVQSVMIESLATLAEYRDPETGGHIKRTQNYVKALALELRKLPKYEELLNEKEIELIYLSVPLHDIGKVGIPDEILLKPGRLTETEFELMKSHTILGHETILRTERKLKNGSFLKYADDVAYTHQEKWDGSGYPNGLKGEAIPLIGRLMAVADVYDALVSKRVYKDAFSHESALQLILQGKGKHFDPDITDALERIQETFRNISIIYADVLDTKGVWREEDNFDINSKNDFSRVHKVLIVEDSRLLLAIFENQLRSLGYYVKTALNGEEAYNLFLQEPFGLIITDLEMPVIDGYELVKKIRSSDELNASSVIIFALSAAQYDLTKEEAQRLGFNDYMLKPLDIELLKYKIAEFTLERPLESELSIL
jgi:putative two-component system response regulator